jgi:hypothetical protein
MYAVVAVTVWPPGDRSLSGQRPARWAAVLGGIVLSLAFWVTGQGFGQFWSGISTDPYTAPLMILLA